MTTVALPQNQWDHRDIIDAWIAPVADVLGQEFEKHAGTIVAQQEQLSIKNWQDHELRQKAVRDGALPIAIGLFADKAAWKGRGAGTRDSTVNYFVNILCQLNRRCLFISDLIFFVELAMAAHVGEDARWTRQRIAWFTT